MTITSLTWDEYQQRHTGRLTCSEGAYLFKNQPLLDFKVEGGTSSVQVITADPHPQRLEYLDAWEMWYATFGTTAVQKEQREALFRLCKQGMQLIKKVCLSYRHCRLEGVLLALRHPSYKLLLTGLRAVVSLNEERPYLADDARSIEGTLASAPGEQLVVYLHTFLMRLERVAACFEECNLARLLLQVRNGEEFQEAMTSIRLILPSLRRQLQQLVSQQTIDSAKEVSYV